MWTIFNFYSSCMFDGGIPPESRGRGQVNWRKEKVGDNMRDPLLRRFCLLRRGRSKITQRHAHTHTEYMHFKSFYSYLKCCIDYYFRILSPNLSPITIFLALMEWQWESFLLWLKWYKMRLLLISSHNDRWDQDIWIFGTEFSAFPVWVEFGTSSTWICLECEEI